MKERRNPDLIKGSRKNAARRALVFRCKTLTALLKLNYPNAKMMKNAKRRHQGMMRNIYKGMMGGMGKVWAGGIRFLRSLGPSLDLLRTTDCLKILPIFQSVIFITVIYPTFGGEK